MNVRPFITLGIIVGLCLINYFALSIKWFQFSGIILGVLILYAFVANFAIKIWQKKKGVVGEENSYCFPDRLAKVMKKVDMRTQYESSLLSMFFILIGLMAFTVYLIFFAEFSFWFKFFTAFNSFWGAVFMLSYLITTYQQYVAYMDSMKIIGAGLASPGEVLPLEIGGLANGR